MNTEASHIPSPCTQVCEIDTESGLCYGCNRTISEIAQWGMFSNEEKKAVLNKIKERQAVQNKTPLEP